MLYDGGFLGAVRIYNYMALYIDPFNNNLVALFSVFGDVLKTKTVYTGIDVWKFIRKADECIRITSFSADYCNNLNDHLFNDALLNIVNSKVIDNNEVIYSSPALDMIISTGGWRSTDKLANTINDIALTIIDADIASDRTIIIVHYGTSAHPVYISTNNGAIFTSLGITLGYYDEQRVVRVFDANNYALFGAASIVQPITNVLRVHNASGWYNAGNIADEITDMRYLDADTLLVETFDLATKYVTVQKLQVSTQSLTTIYNAYSFANSGGAFGMSIVQEYIFLTFPSNNIIVLNLDGTELTRFQITPLPVGGGAIITIYHNFL